MRCASEVKRFATRAGDAAPGIASAPPMGLISASTNERGFRVSTSYNLILVLHIASWTSWMAGLFYLPRIFVYHAEQAPAGGPASEVFKVMERKLLRLIMTPAMLVTWATGLWLAVSAGFFAEGWLHAKLLLVVLMSAFHGKCAVWMKTFAADANTRSGRYFRIANEVPTLIFLLIVVLAILKPF